MVRLAEQCDDPPDRSARAGHFHRATDLLAREGERDEVHCIGFVDRYVGDAGMRAATAGAQARERAATAAGGGGAAATDGSGPAGSAARAGEGEVGAAGRRAAEF